MAAATAECGRHADGVSVETSNFEEDHCVLAEKFVIRYYDALMKGGVRELQQLHVANSIACIGAALGYGGRTVSGAEETARLLHDTVHDRFDRAEVITIDTLQLNACELDIFVHGRMSRGEPGEENADSANFVHTMHLVLRDTTYFVHNEIYRMLDGRPTSEQGVVGSVNENVDGDTTENVVECVGVEHVGVEHVDHHHTDHHHTDHHHTVDTQHHTVRSPETYMEQQQQQQQQHTAQSSWAAAAAHSGDRRSTGRGGVRVQPAPDRLRSSVRSSSSSSSSSQQQQQQQSTSSSLPFQRSPRRDLSRADTDSTAFVAIDTSLISMSELKDALSARYGPQVSVTCIAPRAGPPSSGREVPHIITFPEAANVTDAVRRFEERDSKLFPQGVAKVEFRKQGGGRQMQQQGGRRRNQRQGDDHPGRRSASPARMQKPSEPAAV